MGNFIVGMAVGIALSVFGMGKIVATVEAFVDGSKRIIHESIQDNDSKYPVERHFQNRRSWLSNTQNPWRSENALT